MRHPSPVLCLWDLGGPVSGSEQQPGSSTFFFSLLLGLRFPTPEDNLSNPTSGSPLPGVTQSAVPLFCCSPALNASKRRRRRIVPPSRNCAGAAATQRKTGAAAGAGAEAVEGRARASGGAVPAAGARVPGPGSDGARAVTPPWSALRPYCSVRELRKPELGAVGNTLERSWALVLVLRL